VELNCEDCPYDDPVERYNRYKRLCTPDDPDWQPEYLWCDKVGGEHWQYGYCDDCIDKTSECDVYHEKRKPRLNRYDNLIKHKKDGIKYAVKSQGLDYYYDYRNYFNSIRQNDAGELYARKIYMSGMRKCCRKQTNKKVRHSVVGNYGAYRKMFDYWYTLF